MVRLLLMWADRWRPNQRRTRGNLQACGWHAHAINGHLGGLFRHCCSWTELEMLVDILGSGIILRISGCNLHRISLGFDWVSLLFCWTSSGSKAIVKFLRSAATTFKTRPVLVHVDLHVSSPLSTHNVLNPALFKGDYCLWLHAVGIPATVIVQTTHLKW